MSTSTKSGSLLRSLEAGLEYFLDSACWIFSISSQKVLSFLWENIMHNYHAWHSTFSFLHIVSYILPYTVI